MHANANVIYFGRGACDATSTTRSKDNDTGSTTALKVQPLKCERGGGRGRSSVATRSPVGNMPCAQGGTWAKGSSTHLQDRLKRNREGRQKRQKLESICPVITVIRFVHILQMPQTSIRGGISAQRIRSCTNTEKHHGYSGKCVLLGLRNRDNLMKMTIRQKSANVVGTQQ